MSYPPIWQPQPVLVGRAAGAEFAQAYGPALAEAARWLLRTEQPEGAIVHHLGLPLGRVAGRAISLCPCGWDNRPVVVVEVAARVYGGRGVLLNPMRPGELERFASLLGLLGAPVYHRWNGHPADSGSLALRERAHPSLRAAVARYRQGCAQHGGDVLCGCGWMDNAPAPVRPCWPVR